MTLVRKIVFYGFVALYCLICPITIGYALGYLYKPGQENLIVKTGLIYLSTTPPGAEIVVNQKPHPERTPAVLRGLEPGDYAIGIALEGRKTWMQKVPVEAEKATVLENILLLPKDARPLAHGRARKWQKLAPLRDPLFLAIGEGSAMATSAIFDARDNLFFALADPESPHAGARILAYYTMPDSPLALLRVQQANAERWLRVDAQERPASISDVTALFPHKPERVEWDPRDRETIWSFAGGRLSAHDVGSLATRASVPSLRGYGLFDKRIFAVDSQLRLRRLSSDGSVEAELLDDASLAEAIFGEGQFFEIRPLDRQNFLFLRQDGALYSNRLPYRFVNHGVRGWDWDPQMRRLAVWQRNRLGVIDFGASGEHDDVFEHGPQLVWVLRDGADIGSAAWIHRGTQILFQDGGAINVLDLETYGKPTLHRLADAKPGSAAWSRATGRVYYVDPAGSQLRSLEVVPKVPLLTFPERREEKKKAGIQQL